MIDRYMACTGCHVVLWCRPRSSTDIMAMFEILNGLCSIHGPVLQPTIRPSADHDGCPCVQGPERQHGLASSIMGVCELLLQSDDHLHVVLIGILPKTHACDAWGRWSTAWPNRQCGASICDSGCCVQRGGREHASWGW